MKKKKTEPLKPTFISQIRPNMKIYTIALFALVMSASLYSQSHGENSNTDDALSVIAEPATGSGFNKIVVYNSKGLMLDTLLLLDGEVEVLDYYASGLDSISIVFSHIYGMPQMYKPVYFLLCTLDENSGFYNGRRVTIFQHTDPIKGIKQNNKSDPFYCRDFKITDHLNISYQRQIEVGSDQYIHSSTNMISDVKIVGSKSGLKSRHEEVIFSKY